MLAHTTKDARPSLLFLGDSRERDLHRLMSAQFCADDWFGFPWTAPAVPDALVAGGATCRDGSFFARIGYFLHYGVSTDPPYHEKQRTANGKSRGGWQNHRHVNWTSGQDPDRADSSTQLALQAWARFRSCVPESSPIITILT
eukprot:1965313-Prymnesium_polylepis.2